MNVLVVGGGGREHALAWAICRSPNVDRVYVAPGNAGTNDIAENVDIAVDDLDALLAFVQNNAIDLTVVGPEAPLVAGIVDLFRANDRLCFGPTKAAARLEGSKVFAKAFMKTHGIPTAKAQTFDEPSAAKKYIEEAGAPVVIKADGLAQGKGVVVAMTIDEAFGAVDTIMVERQFGASGNRVLVEEFLEGEEVSIHAICADGQAVLFPSSQDHKRAFDGDRGPNTGGMGAYAPVPLMGDELQAQITNDVILPTLSGMEEEGCPYSGVLYAGLMMTSSGPKVLEYNVRFGDPETQVLMPLVKGDFAGALRQAAGRSAPTLEFHAGRSVATVVIAAGGYPGSYKKGMTINGVSTTDDDTRVVFHAGTAMRGGDLVTTGGRVLAVSAWSASLTDALTHAYNGVKRVEFEGAHWRKDIGRRAL